MRVLVDTNVLVDVMRGEEPWFSSSAAQLAEAADRSTLVINPVIYAEVSVRFTHVEDLDRALPPRDYRRLDLPWAAAFLAGKSFLAYRTRGGRRPVPLPDFYIGAHAAVAGYRLLTRDAARYRTYFPTLELIAPSRGGFPTLDTLVHVCDRVL